MLISRISLTKFMVHDDISLDLPPRGITLISGANGAGKSSFAEGVASVWNRSLRKKSSRKTRGFRRGVAGAVKVTLADGTEISRTCSKSGTSNLVFAAPGETPTKFATPTKAQEVLETTIGPYDLWRRSCVFSSSDASGFTSATDSERRTLLEELLDLDRFSRAHDLAKTLHKDLVHASSRLDGEILGAQREAGLVEEHIQTVEENIRASPKPAPLPSFDRDGMEAKVAALTAEISVMEAAREASRERVNLVARIDMASETLASLTLPDAPAAADPSADLARLRATWLVLDGEVTQLQARVAARKAKWVEDQLALNTAQAELQQAHKRADALADGECPMCTQPILPAVRHRLAATVAANLQVFTDRKAALDRPPEADEEIQLLAIKESERQAIRDAGNAAAADEKNRAARLKEWEAQRARIQNERVQWERKVQLLQEKLAGVSSAAFTETDAECLRAITTQMREIQSEISQHVASARTHETARESWEKSNTRWRKDLADRKAQREDLRTRFQVLEESRESSLASVGVAEAGVAVLSPKGVRAHILQRSLTAIETICNRWLREFHDTMLIKLSPYSESASGAAKVAISLKIQGREEGDEYEDLSSGERRRLDLAMVLALSEVARLSQGVAAWGTLFLDEILDAIDVSGADRVCEAIRRLSVDRSVVVISHNRAIRDRLKPVQEVTLG